MCQFKSGIILKTRSYVAEGNDDSHSALLEKLNIVDNVENAMTKFVRVELIPENNEWWVNPTNWNFHVDQDIVPDWFDEDREKYLEEFRDRVIEWWNNHIFVDKNIENLNTGYYRLKRCKVKSLFGDVRVLLDNSTVETMFDNSIVEAMFDNSTVETMFDNSIIKAMYNNSTVETMFDNSIVEAMYNNSIVKAMYDNSTVRRMYNNSIVRRMYDGSTVRRMYNNSIVRRMYDESTVRRMYDESTVRRMYDGSTVRRMYDESTVRRMYDESIIIDNLNCEIEISETNNVKIIRHKNG